jgi:Tol biopolymer transport system component
MAQPFDADRLRLTGDAVQLEERVGSSGAYGYFSVVGDVIAYRHGTVGAPVASQLTWVDRTGKSLAAVAEPANYISVTLSNDATHAAVATSLQTVVGAPDIWLVDLRRAVRTRFTFESSTETAPVWSPDDSRIVFRSNRTGAGDLYAKVFDGSAAEEPLLKSDRIKTPTSWSPDGRFILFTQSAGPQTSDDIWLLPVDGDRQPVRWLQTDFNERQGRFSPDGRWIAYVSNESGRDEIYVRPFVPPASGSPAGGKWQVTRDGGDRPGWRRDGKELFFRSPSGALMVVDVVAGSAFQSGEPQTLVNFPLNLLQLDASPDGQRFLIARPVQPANAAPITVELNWQSRLAR